MECVRRFLRAADSHSTSGDSKICAADIEDYFKMVAKTGKTHVPWKKLKSVLISKVSRVMDNFCSLQEKSEPSSDEEKGKELKTVKERILQRLNDFDGIPFTIQRIAELVIEPNKNYKLFEKYLRAVEKNVMVITTIDPTGNRIVTESQQIAANTWNENLLPPPSPSSRVRRMSVDEMADTSSNVPSPMVAAAMMPPPPSPPPFSPKQQKSPIPADVVDTGEPLTNNNACRNEENCSSVDQCDSQLLMNKTKKAVIVRHGDSAKKSCKSPVAISNSVCEPTNTTENQDSPPREPQKQEVNEDPSDLQQRVEPSVKKQRFEDELDCDSTTPDTDNSSSQLTVSTVT